MTIHIQQVQAFKVSGLQVRTCNADERDNATAKIGLLWGQFSAQQLPVRLPHQTESARVIGAYSNYESDATGSFDVTAGMAVSAPAPDMSTIDIEEGRYLVFPCKGEMPKAVIEGWQKVWSYFENQPERRRRYRTDFEEYLSMQEALIYIGIE